MVASGSFGFSIEGGLLTVTTDEGSAEVALRTAEGDDATADALVALEALASGGSEAGAVGGSDGVDDASGSAAEAGGARDGDE